MDGRLTLRCCELAGTGGQAGADRAVDAASPAAGVTVQTGPAGRREKLRVGERGGQEPGGGELAERERGPVEGVVSLPLAGVGDAPGFAVQDRLGVAAGVRGPAHGQRRRRAKHGGSVRRVASQAGSGAGGTGETAM